MHLAVVDHDADVAGVGARQRALVHLLHDTLQDGGHEARVDGAADDCRVELQFAAPRQVVLLLALDVDHHVALARHLVVLRFGHPLVVGLDDHVHLAELSGAARLLLVAVVGLCDLRDGLAVGNLRGDVVVGELVLREDARTQDVQVVFALALDDRLLELLGVVDQDRRVLELGVVEDLAELLLIALLLALEGCAVARFREYDGLDRHGRRGGRERIVRARALEFDGAADVAGRELRHLDAVLARHGEELRELLLVARAGVHQLGAFGDLAADDAEVGDLADVLLDLALEDERHDGSRLVGSHLLALGGEELRGLERSGGHVDDELHQTLRADVVLAAGAEDGHHLAVGHADLQTRADVVLREGPLVEVELHEGLVVLGGHLDELLVELLGALQLLGGDFELLAVSVVVLEAVHLHQQHVDEGVELRTLVDGILHQHGLHARGGLDRLEGGLEVGLVGVELVDDADDGFLEQAGIAGLYFAADLPAVDGAEEEEADVADLERREEASAEVVRTRAVDDVQLAVHEFGEEDR